MENVIHQTTAQDIFKILYWLMAAGGALAVTAAGLVWKASRKIADIDAQFAAHEAAAEFHAKDDAREFGLISKAIDDQKIEWQQVRAKIHEQNSSLKEIEKLVAVMQSRLIDVADDIKEMRAGK